MLACGAQVLTDLLVNGELLRQDVDPWLDRMKSRMHRRAERQKLVKRNDRTSV